MNYVEYNLSKGKRLCSHFRIATESAYRGRHRGRWTHRSLFFILLCTCIIINWDFGAKEVRKDSNQSTSLSESFYWRTKERKHFLFFDSSFCWYSMLMGCFMITRQKQKPRNRLMNFKVFNVKVVGECLTVWAINWGEKMSWRSVGLFQIRLCEDGGRGGKLGEVDHTGGSFWVNLWRGWRRWTSCPLKENQKKPGCRTEEDRKAAWRIVDLFMLWTVMRDIVDLEMLLLLLNRLLVLMFWLKLCESSWSRSSDAHFLSCTLHLVVIIHLRALTGEKLIFSSSSFLLL